ncbi:hypothetical protein PIN31115_01640 [Pandoraea iniqua]|uniref:Uncharacterized protein n=1 Tax=Pandoraea iniqua TaxID=2508288 RepID=A0A5E4TVS5_9BURK|nr:hypothetical protein PIN31115_01640 [Pandoraea iniqua]
MTKGDRCECSVALWRFWSGFPVWPCGAPGYSAFSRTSKATVIKRTKITDKALIESV